MKHTTQPFDYLRESVFIFLRFQRGSADHSGWDIMTAAVKPSAS